MKSRITITDIAKEAGVSTALVSFVMSNKAKGSREYRVRPETEKRVLEVAAKYDYQPNSSARALRSGEYRTIGVVLSDISNKFYAEISRQIENWAFHHDYVVLFGSSDENPKKLSNVMKVFKNKGVDGMIIVPCEGSESAISQMAGSGMPVVLLDRDIPGAEFSSVVLNNFKASGIMTEKLLHKGFRRIEMVSYKTTLSNIKDREAGYLDVMENSGLSGARIHRPEYCNYDEIKQIVLDANKRKTEALIFSTYNMSLMGRKAFLSNGLRVPQDCFFACFNNSDVFDLYEPDIMYVKQPIEQFAVESMTLLIRKINGSEGAQSCTKVILQPEIVVSSDEVRI